MLILNVRCQFRISEVNKENELDTLHSNYEFMVLSSATHNCYTSVIAVDCRSDFMEDILMFQFISKTRLS